MYLFLAPNGQGIPVFGRFPIIHVLYVLIRTHHGPKNHLFPYAYLHTFGPDYYPRCNVEFYCLREAIIIRTHDVPKNPYLPLFLNTILGLD